MQKDRDFKRMARAKRARCEDLTQLSAAELAARLEELECHRRDCMQVAHATYGRWFVRHIQDELREYQRQIEAIRAEARARVAVYEVAFAPLEQMAAIRQVAGL